MTIRKYLSEKIKWQSRADALFPYVSDYNGQQLSIRINDFPAQNLYTLIVGSEELDFDDWPLKWSRPGAPGSRAVRIKIPSRGKTRLPRHVLGREEPFRRRQRYRLGTGSIESELGRVFGTATGKRRPKSSTKKVKANLAAKSKKVSKRVEAD